MRQILSAIALFAIMVVIMSFTIETLLCLFSGVPSEILSNVNKEQNYAILGTRG